MRSFSESTLEDVRLRWPAMGLLGTNDQVPVGAVRANDMMPVNGNGAAPFPEAFIYQWINTAKVEKTKRHAADSIYYMCYEFAIRVLHLPCLIIVVGRGEK